MKQHNKGIGDGTGGHSEDVDQGCRCSQLVRNGEKSESAGAGLKGERAGDAKAGDAIAGTNADSKQLASQSQVKIKHGSSFFRVGSKHAVASADDQAQRERYNRAEKVRPSLQLNVLPH